MSAIEYLDFKEIDYKTSGTKNVGSGWVGVETCPFCYASGHHFGVNTTSGSFNCWICGEKGKFTKLVSKVEGCSFSKAKKIAGQYVGDIGFDDRDSKFENRKIENIFPKGILKTLPQKHMNWLEMRNFNASFIAKKYKLMAYHTTGKYRFSIIAPVFINGEIVNYVVCDVTGSAKSKYRFPSNETINVPIGSCLYNYDTLREGGEAIIVEGTTDVWRLGDKAVGLLHKRITPGQLNLLAAKELERVTIVPDEGAEDAAEYTANQISGIIDNCEIVKLEAGDPADLTIDEVRELRRYIGI